MVRRICARPTTWAEAESPRVCFLPRHGCGGVRCGCGFSCGGTFLGACSWSLLVRKPPDDVEDASEAMAGQPTGPGDQSAVPVSASVARRAVLIKNLCTRGIGGGLHCLSGGLGVCLMSLGDAFAISPGAGDAWKCPHADRLGDCIGDNEPGDAGCGCHHYEEHQ